MKIRTPDDLNLNNYFVPPQGAQEKHIDLELGGGKLWAPDFLPISSSSLPDP